jgi:uncharacterized protein YdeI (YjbR/CyaY-like superfamily)
MFDNNSFSRSELNFTTLQLLRASSEWIRGGIEDLESLAEALAWFYGALSDFPKRIPDDQTTLNVSAVLELNWKNVISHQKRSSTYTYHSC